MSIASQLIIQNALQEVPAPLHDLHCNETLGNPTRRSMELPGFQARTMQHINKSISSSLPINRPFLLLRKKYIQAPPSYDP